MICYDVNEDRIIARFDFISANQKEVYYWIDNITNNIIRKYNAHPFRHLIYTLARDCVCKRSTLYGKMNEPPNEELGKRIAKQRLLEKYNDLEQKVAKKFLKCVKQLKDEHIIKYDKDRVILLDIVKNKMQFQTKDLTFCSEYVNVGGNQIALKSTSVADFLFDGVEIKELIGQYDTLDIEYFKSQEGEGFVIIDADGKMFKLKTYEYELQKQLRTFKDYYNNIKQKAGSHPISCPSKIKIQQKYSHIHDTDRLYEGLQQIIEEVNNNDI